MGDPGQNNLLFLECRASFSQASAGKECRNQKAVSLPPRSTEIAASKIHRNLQEIRLLHKIQIYTMKESRVFSNLIVLHMISSDELKVIERNCTNRWSLFVAVFTMLEKSTQIVCNHPRDNPHVILHWTLISYCSNDLEDDLSIYMNYISEDGYLLWLAAVLLGFLYCSLGNRRIRQTAKKICVQCFRNQLALLKAATGSWNRYF